MGYCDVHCCESGVALRGSTVLLLIAKNDQRGAPCDPGPVWAAWNTVRPEAAVAGVVTAHARLLDAVAGLDDADLRRHGPTRFGFEASGRDLLLAEAAHERASPLASARACRSCLISAIEMDGRNRRKRRNSVRNNPSEPANVATSHFVGTYVLHVDGR